MIPAHTTSTLTSMIESANAAATAAIDDPTRANTQWTGESFLRLYAAECRDIQARMITNRSAYRVHSGQELHTLANIPGNLVMALCRLIPEAVPAICNAIPNKDCAAIALESLQRVTNEIALVPLQNAHAMLESEYEQFGEMQRWSGREGILIDCMTAVALVFDHIAKVTALFVPIANPQARMASREATIHLDSLKTTMADCA